MSRGEKSQGDTSQGRTEPTPPTTHAARFENLSGQAVDENLVELLEKGPKFTLTQSIQNKTLREVEMGVERGAFALRWRIEFQKRGARGANAQPRKR